MLDLLLPLTDGEAAADVAKTDSRTEKVVREVLQLLVGWCRGVIDDGLGGVIGELVCRLVFLTLR